jgi:hypothetical protein
MSLMAVDQWLASAAANVRLEADSFVGVDDDGSTRQVGASRVRAFTPAGAPQFPHSAELTPRDARPDPQTAGAARVDVLDRLPGAELDRERRARLNQAVADIERAARPATTWPAT